MTDESEQTSAVRREVGTRMLEAGVARTVTITRLVDGPIDDVWDACTNPDRIPRWFLPVSGELRPGGRFQLEGNAGGTITRCDPPAAFDATWEHSGEVSWIELRLTAQEGGGATCLELTHISQVDDRWEQYGPGAVGVGWDVGLMGLARHLGPGPAIDPAQGAAWMRSEEGRRFMTLSSEGWHDAHVAAGEDRAVARAAADRTTAAYTA